MNLIRFGTVSRPQFFRNLEKVSKSFALPVRAPLPIPWAGTNEKSWSCFTCRFSGIPIRSPVAESPPRPHFLSPNFCCSFFAGPTPDRSDTARQAKNPKNSGRFSSASKRSCISPINNLSTIFFRNQAQN